MSVVMLSVIILNATYKPFVLSVIRPVVIWLSVMALILGPVIQIFYVCKLFRGLVS